MDRKSRENGGEEQLVRERVQELSWALVDEQLNADELPLLENLLLSDENARRTYLECVQMHSDLLAHFAAPPKKVTPNIGTKVQPARHLDFGLPFDSQSRTSDEALQ